MFGIEDLPGINERRELVLAQAQQKRAQELQALENLREQDEQPPEQQ